MDKNLQQEWNIAIGLEIHAQLKTHSKLFSRTSKTFGQLHNDQVSFIDAAMPGTLPVLNIKAVELAVKAGLVLNANINKLSYFDRKNYFYPDCPAGYQISQFFKPIVQNGFLNILDKKGTSKRINIDRIHIEQDAGKSIHDDDKNYSYIDLNRAGIPLIEIVTKPEFVNITEVDYFLKELRNILRFCDICDGNLENGSMRCDANVSIHLNNDSVLGTRVEIKNLNSFKNVGKAISSEFNRQVKIKKLGNDIIQETRLYDTVNDRTKSMRVKEEAGDYRYFPDPDLLPLNISEDFINNIKISIPELPDIKRKKYINELGIHEKYAEIIINDKNLVMFFEYLVTKIKPQVAASWLVCELLGRLNKQSLSLSQLPISHDHFLALLVLINSGKISGKIGKEVLDKMFIQDQSPSLIIEKYQLMQNSGRELIQKYVNIVIDSYPSQVEGFKKGKIKLLGFLIGQAMRISKGTLNPKLLNEIMIQKLSD